VVVLQEGGRRRGALACAPLAGAGALVWPPAVVTEDGRQGREDVLVRHACAWLRGQGVKLAQALLAPAEEGLAAPLARNGFDPITDLWYLRHDLSLPPGLLG